MPKTIIIKARELFDGKTKRENVYVIVEGNKIVDILSNSGEIQGADYEGFVTPAFIDAHSHIGMAREGESEEFIETNEIFDDLFQPLNNPLNSVNFNDSALKLAVEFGILYSCILPGSFNLIGGKAIVARNFSSNKRNSLFRDIGYKMALGLNSCSSNQDNPTRPVTRMGLYATLEKKLSETLKKKISSPEGDFSLEEKALLDIVSGRKIIKVHMNTEDDVFYLVEIVQKFGLKVTAEHLLEVFSKNVFNELEKNGIGVVYGPLDTFYYDVDLRKNYKGINSLIRSKVFYGLMSDHPVLKILYFKDSLKFFLMHGMSDAEAISLITYKNAKLLGIDDMLGTIEPGKLASIVVWDKHPLYLGSFPLLILGEGKILKKKG